MLWNGSHFVPSSDNFYVAVPRTESSINASIVTELVNFRPYQFRVSAINALGLSSSFGPGRPQVYSRPSPPITPIVSAPSPPRNGRGAAGNKEDAVLRQARMKEFLAAEAQECAPRRAQPTASRAPPAHRPPQPAGLSSS